MYKKIIFISLIVLLTSCEEQGVDKTPISKEKISLDSKLETDTLTIPDTVHGGILISNKPCEPLQDFVLAIENQDLISDTLRIRKVNIYSELNNDSITFFRDRPFYKMEFEKSRIATSYFADSASTNYNMFGDNSVEIHLFRNVKNIWAYFYRDKNATEWISDGVLEQWEFASEEDAQNALDQIEPIGGYIYFNTSPYFSRIENKLIIFQTRAMAFSYDQAKLYDLFQQEFVPEEN